MAQPLSLKPESWQEGLAENNLLPSRYTNGLFIGSGVEVANNELATIVVDMLIPDARFKYDNRYINGRAGTNSEGHDGWGASAYGVFQDIMWDARYYTMGRDTSCAFRLFEDPIRSGAPGTWGTESSSNVISMSLEDYAKRVKEVLTKWQQKVLGPDIDKYTIFAVLNGHMGGMWVDQNDGSIFDGEGQWVATPGSFQGQSYPPRFAPIHGIEWDDRNLPLLLQNVKVTWNNLFIPQDNRILLLDPFYEYRFMAALTGNSIPATDSAFSMIENGSFKRLMGWDISFEIPTEYWPKLYVDANLNVVHSASGTAAFDAVINSIDGGTNPDLVLQNQLAASDRMIRLNYVKTIWDDANGEFKKIVTNYPLGIPAKAPYLGDAEENTTGGGSPLSYPFMGYPERGHGLDNATGPISPISRQQVIGMFLYKKAAQVSQEYEEVYTEEEVIRFKGIEMVTRVKYDAWVIEGLSHGIIPIFDVDPNSGVSGIPVQVVENANVPQPQVTQINASPAQITLKEGETAVIDVEVLGIGAYDPSYSSSSDSGDAAVFGNTVEAYTAGGAKITFTSTADPSKEVTVNVIVVTP
jgi:hypothetical protein